MKQYFFAMLSLVVFGFGCTATGVPDSASVDIASSVALDLHGRGLTTIPMDIFSRTNLVKLDLSSNRLTGAPPAQIAQLANLTSLDLSDNMLTGLPAEIGKLKNLETLDVSHNHLTGLPLELGDLTQLRVLDVSGNAYSAQDLDQIASRLPHTEIRR